MQKRPEQIPHNRGTPFNKSLDRLAKSNALYVNMMLGEDKMNHNLMIVLPMITRSNACT